jgi:hypothetical protein
MIINIRYKNGVDRGPLRSGGKLPHLPSIWAAQLRLTSLNCGYKRAYCSFSTWYMRMESHGGMILTGKSEELWEKPVPVPVWPSRIPPWLIRARSRGSAVRAGEFRIVFWDVLPCKIIVDRRFRGTCYLHHQEWVILDDGGSTDLWNVGRQLFYTAVLPRRQFWT